MEGEEPVVSLVDVLEEDEELEEEASAVLGASDAEHCSYSQVYVKRQALYACGTCCPPGGAAAGVCLACSYKCHEGHQLYELYTKRNFRCDCGNSKFKDVTCKLNPDKEEVNSDNKYSHNFFGLYCTCSRPYPDPEDQVEDQMIQCVICEDWLHGRHLGAPVPDSVELQEMICESCMNHNQFLWTYAAQITVSDPEVKPGPDQPKEDPKQEPDEEPSCKRPRHQEEPEVKAEEGAELKEAGLKEGAGLKEEEPKGACRLKELQLIGQSRSQSGATFWPSGWRSRLCTCQDCQTLLSEAGSLFLLDEGDTVLAYETKGKSLERTNESAADPLMSALDRLNRVQQLELIHEYNDLKTELKDFLQRFASEGKVVTPDDIRQFFEQQQSRKRRRANGQLYSA
ncbi:putative E3 ubiquitin-protein ligase UBR7 [Boleophthalmus pectinirostris]|uniref:putative E3 ubiquitin-protein ligase UBR7 n=1 Tax=Boleophthalmus pectinirostris TaxID=150288 RepID=UPI00242D7C09|nr:putative E3 ubiquitin-protein ligase UBR7 [Boleophthalmus pectinirostris]